MKKAIILHGMSDNKQSYYNPDGDAESNSHWLPWLQKQLIVRDVLAQTPEMPEPHMPNYEKWCSVFNQFKIDEETDLIGHSCGAGFLLRWLTENKQKVRKVVLVAPWVDPTNELGDQNTFFNFEIDAGLAERTSSVYIFNSSNDDEVIHESVKRILEKLPSAQLIEMKNKGHFTFSGMSTRKFPELAATLLE
ncbi:MAG: alpha/beta fold hydrolase [Candidatus Campbellbacteria bacterium]|nr:alpha/beta fold hydrolase [Candidatus Campbellbacteria bacterium]